VATADRQRERQKGARRSVHPYASRGTC
jgi:hypothetical protein